MAPRIPGKPGGNSQQMSLFGGSFFEFLFRLITGDSGWFGSNGFIGGFFSRIVEATTLTGMRWGQVDDHEIDIADLQTNTQKLLGVIGYGSAYMPESSGWTFGEYTRLPFTARKGPIVGCTHNTSTGAYVLHSKGLWEVNYKAYFDFLAGPVNKDCFLRAAVYAPNGTLFDESRLRDTTSDPITMGESARFVVPAANYRIQIEGYAGTAYREILTSRSRSSFNILKISDETD